MVEFYSLPLEGSRQEQFKYLNNFIMEENYEAHRLYAYSMYCNNEIIVGSINSHDLEQAFLTEEQREIVNGNIGRAYSLSSIFSYEKKTLLRTNDVITLAKNTFDETDNEYLNSILTGSENEHLRSSCIYFTGTPLVIRFIALYNDSFRLLLSTEDCSRFLFVNFRVIKHFLSIIQKNSFLVVNNKNKQKELW